MKTLKLIVQSIFVLFLTVFVLPAGCMIAGWKYHHYQLTSVRNEALKPGADLESITKSLPNDSSLRFGNCATFLKQHGTLTVDNFSVSEKLAEFSKLSGKSGQKIDSLAEFMKAVNSLDPEARRACLARTSFSYRFGFRHGFFEFETDDSGKVKNVSEARSFD